MASELWAERQAQIAKDNAATKIENLYRGYLVRRNIHALYTTATLIQKALRGHYIYVEYRMLITDVTIVQSHVHSWIVKTRLLNANKSATKIQALLRRRFAAQQTDVLRAQKTLLEKKNLAVVTLERIWRGLRPARCRHNTHQRGRFKRPGDALQPMTNTSFNKFPLFASRVTSGGRMQ